MAFAKRNELLTARKTAENAAAMQTAGTLYHYFLNHRQEFNKLSEEPSSKPIANGFWGVLKGEAGLFRSGTDKSGMYLLIHNEQVKFYTIYSMQPIQGTLADESVLQLEFSRIGNSDYTVNIAKHIFFDCLLSDNFAIASRTNLTWYEQNIWINAIAFALEHPDRYSVSAINPQKYTIKIISKEQADNITNEYHWLSMEHGPFWPIFVIANN